jgi:hypothetical protein
VDPTICGHRRNGWKRLMTRRASSCFNVLFGIKKMTGTFNTSRELLQGCRGTLLFKLVWDMCSSTPLIRGLVAAGLNREIDKGTICYRAIPKGHRQSRRHGDDSVGLAGNLGLSTPQLLSQSINCIYFSLHRVLLCLSLNIVRVTESKG